MVQGGADPIGSPEHDAGVAAAASAAGRGEGTAAPRRRAWWSVLLVVTACGVVVGGLPLLLGPPNGDDAYYHAMRAQQEARCWLGGAFLPRWYPDLNGGLGGPEPRAYPLVPLALHGALALAWGDAVAATSVASVLIPVLAGLAMVWAGRRRGWPPGPTLAVACAWAASPYLVIAVHERAALAEGWGLAILPLVLDALLPPRPASAQGVRRAAILFALLVAIQLPLTLMTVLIVAAWHLASGRAGHPLRAFAAGVWGLGLAAFSWVPNLAALWRLQGDRLTGGSYSWRTNLLPGGVAHDPQLAGRLAAVLAALALAALVVAVVARGAPRSYASAALLAGLLVTPLASPLYGLLPGLGLLQFPWRWLGPATCLLLVGLVPGLSRKLRALVLAILLVPLLSFPGLRWRLPPGPPLEPSATFSSSARAAMRYGVPPILPSLPAYLPRGSDLRQALAAAPEVRRRLPVPLRDGPSAWSWDLDGPAALVELPLLAGPGWTTTLDGRAVPWRAVRGLVAVDVGSGRHRLEAAQGWLVEDASGAGITSVAVLGLALGAYLSRRRSRAAG
jgi:hypothetical protein